MAKRAWMPFYVGDYRADTTRLSTEEHGAYLLLIMDYWTNGPPPDDDARLARIVLVEPERWAELRPIIAPFFRIKAGRWRHKRVDAEIERADGIIEARRAAGRAGMAKRWKNNGLITYVITNGITNAYQTAYQNDIPSPPPSQREEERPTDAAQAPLVNGFVDAKTKLFRDGLSILKSATGRTEPTCRALLGKWLKQCANDAAIVQAAIEGARSTADPVAYIRQTLEKQFPIDDPGNWVKS